MTKQMKSWCNIQKSADAIHHIKRLKKKKSMSISINAEKALTKFPTNLC